MINKLKVFFNTYYRVIIPQYTHKNLDSYQSEFHIPKWKFKLVMLLIKYHNIVPDLQLKHPDRMRFLTRQKIHAWTPGLPEPDKTTVWEYRRDESDKIYIYEFPKGTKKLRKEKEFGN